MGLSRIGKRAAVLVVAGLLGVGASVGSAQASPGAGYIGDGYGNNAHGVWCVQHLINDVVAAHGKGRPLNEDSAWGPNTKSWVEWYQDGAGLSKDGVVGRDTGAALLRDGDSYYGGYNYCYTYVPSTF
ncbi:peptidoglycan-binding protein [Kitasatospora sp. NPDC056651]|uniref:peptidoglycan-binding protein n=1 Tax=Kitasatospora sp. NPDC056651 TaxID=3345892 RepID=UPI00367A2FAA